MQRVALFMERFPSLGLWMLPALQEGSFGEEEVVLPPPPDVEVLYVYGLSTEAYLSLRQWLKQEPKRKLVFLENRLPRFSRFLFFEDSVSVLQDTQVDIRFLPKRPHLFSHLEQIAKDYPVSSLEIIAPRFRRTRYFKELKEWILRKTVLSDAILRDRLHGHVLFSHFIKNTKHLARSFYFNALQGAFKDVPAILCGAGPSLSSSWETLAKLEDKALVFACGSAIGAFAKAGISPHFCVSIDPNEEEFFRVKQSVVSDAPLLYSLRVHPSVLSATHAPLGYIRSIFSDLSQLWLEEELKYQEPLLGENLSSESISVMSLAVAVACFLGCNPIVFCGVDMSYSEKKRYCPEVAVDSVKKEDPFAADREVLLRNFKGKKTHSATRWIMESATLAEYARRARLVTFMNASENGLQIEGVCHRPLPCIAETFSETRDLRGYIHAAISCCSMHQEEKKVSALLGQLQLSLQNVIKHLEVLCGKEKGSKVLSEIELKEELAFRVLFYDALDILLKKKESPLWPSFLQLALSYERGFSSL